MDDLIEICDKIENCNKSKNCNRNEVVCVRKVLRSYTDNDYDKILKLKAEIDIHRDFDKSILNNLSFLLSFMSWILAILYNVSIVKENGLQLYIVYAVFFLILLFMVITIVNMFFEKTSSRSKWIKYISIVIEDIEKEYDKKNIN